MADSEYRRQVQEQIDRAAEEARRLRDHLMQAPPGGPAPAARAPAPPAAADDAGAFVGILLDRGADLQRRLLALDALRIEISNRPDLIDLVIGLLRDTTEPEELRHRALTVLRAASFSAAVFAPKRAEFLDALRVIVDDPSHVLREDALEVLSQEKDEYAQRRLLEGLENPAVALTSPEKSLQFLGYDVHAEHYPLIRRLAENPPNPELKLQAVRLLGSDPASKDLLTSVLMDKSERAETRSASAAALQSLAPDEFQQLARQLVLDDSENETVRAASISALDHFARPPAPGAGSDFLERVKQLQNTTSGELRRAATRFVHRRRQE
ncbi:MAG TPA: HEAT repeat domain-containing protein [Vicinamibacterales bacterium]|nr:HEAT repeat domain-containing protein [Vicinamibacterales bacterium]